MAIFNVSEGGFQEVKAGVYYAIFSRIESGEKDGKKFFRWVFTADDGKEFVGFSDTENPTTNNKFGRWLCGLTGNPVAGTVNTDQHEGKRYALIYQKNQNGKVALYTFSPCES